jgi:hypothetical protein
MIIETNLYPADEPWQSIGYTEDQANLETSLPILTDSKLKLSTTLAQIDEFFHAATVEDHKVAGVRMK